MGSIFNRKSKIKNKVPQVHQFLFLEAPVGLVSEQVIVWGESTWWPKDCLWKYIRKTDGEIRVGTEYVIKINKPSAADWMAEITQLLPHRLVERTFTKGMFKGFERVIIEEKANGTRIDYELYFQIRGLLNLLLWPFVLKSQYAKTIKGILGALRDYIASEKELYQNGQDGTK